jgi:hypothetical protein
VLAGGIMAEGGMATVGNLAKVSVGFIRGGWRYQHLASTPSLHPGRRSPTRFRPALMIPQKIKAGYPRGSRPTSRSGWCRRC